jgi:hypothetical protein
MMRRNKKSWLAPEGTNQLPRWELAVVTLFISYGQANESQT